MGDYTEDYQDDLCLSEKDIRVLAFAGGFFDRDLKDTSV